MFDSNAREPAGTTQQRPLAVGPMPHAILSVGDIARRHREAGIAAGLVVLGLAITAACALLSPEGVHQFDDLTHYLYAKWAWRWPAYLLDDWGRPGFTVLYFLPAGLGWPACRILSAVLTAAAAWMAFRIAQMLGLRYAWAVVALAYAQPLFFQLSHTTLTETPLAFYTTAAAYLALRGRWSGSAAVLSLGFVTRHEAIIFLPIWLFFARRQGVSLWRLWPMIWAPLVVNILAWAAGMRPLIERLLEPRPTTQYGFGGWLTFFARSLHAWGPGVMVLAMTGLWSLTRRRGGAFIAICIAVYFAGQTIVRALGLFDSGGYARFLVPISPWVAIAALSGWLRLWDRDAAVRRVALIVAGCSMVLLWLSMERELVLIAHGRAAGTGLAELATAQKAIQICTGVFITFGFVALVRMRRSSEIPWTTGLVPIGVTAMILLTCYALCRPLAPPPEAPLIENLKRDLALRGLGDREIVSANVWLDYATGRALPPDRPSVREQIERAPIGGLFAWERQFAGSADHKLELDEFLQSPSFRLVLETPPGPYAEGPYLRVFEKIGVWDGRTSPDSP